jgi:single-stranded DNA-binding protein ssb
MTLNRVVIQGRMAHDPDVQGVGANKLKAEFTLAVDRGKDGNGQPREANFIRCVAWNAMAERVETYFQKGKPALVEGELNTYSYTNKQGQKVFVTEVLAHDIHFQQGESQGEGANGGYNRGTQGRSFSQNKQEAPQNGNNFNGNGQNGFASSQGVGNNRNNYGNNTFGNGGYR